jgi:hypothetical protein
MESLEEPEDRLGMSEEQWERFQRLTHSFGEQSDEGADLSIIAALQKLTPTERYRRMKRMRPLHEELLRASARAGNGTAV